MDVLDGDGQAVGQSDASEHRSEAALAENVSDPVRPVERLGVQQVHWVMVEVVMMMVVMMMVVVIVVRSSARGRASRRRHRYCNRAQQQESQTLFHARD